MKGNKGQAAMEFLMTYGWAILAAVIVIAVLAYFGVFNPQTYVPDRCTLTPPLGCKEAIVSISATTGLTFDIQNGAGSSIAVSSVAVEGCTSDTTGYTIADGESQRIVLTCAGLTAGDKFNGDATVTYTRGTSDIPLQSTGQMISRVGA
jgi:uncharacterized protein (UPF0333 family)